MTRDVAEAAHSKPKSASHLRAFWLPAGCLLAAAVWVDLILQAPLAGLAVSFLALLWTAAAVVSGLLKRHSVFATLRSHQVSVSLIGTYFASVACGLIVSHLVFSQAQGLREQIRQSRKSGTDVDTAALQNVYDSFCTSRWNGRCGWMNYRILYNTDGASDQRPGASGVLVVFQFFTERVAISVETGQVVERRSVD
ncbi:hypothetical protein [Acidovorax sp. Leaf78]|uniref:hypothetical protein n=1 Tax=Acidovorax sp. Leaf78 TaxID=1736237 RepID=UPI0012E22093|nr:hypothetical protein [Acidovorax sp. Leaf78]